MAKITNYVIIERSLRSQMITLFIDKQQPKRKFTNFTCYFVQNGTIDVDGNSLGTEQYCVERNSTNDQLEIYECEGVDIETTPTPPRKNQAASICKTHDVKSNMSPARD